MSSADQLGFSFKPADRRIWTVRDLVAAVRTHIEREYGDTWVEGEISNFRAHDSGHLYFTLKDQNSQIRAVMFRSQARLLRFRPENGMQVVLRGRVTIYEDRGELQISAEYLEPKGAGALQIAFEQLKAKLEAEGLFDGARKKAIPTLPRRIGIVTSPQAAALRDILNILLRRHHTASVLIYPAQVQGEAASAEVSAGVRYFNRARSVDVIIVARGGGSAEDLAAFNHEGLARVIAASEIPVISAVGHETDFTIIDFVADLRAPTPSAAAELVIRSRQEVEEQAEGLRERLTRAVRYRLLMGRQALTELAQHGAFARMVDVINRRQQKLDDLKNRLDRAERQILEQHRRKLEVAAAAVRHYDVRRMLASIRQELDARVAGLASATRTALLQRSGRLNQLEGQLQALSPLAILDRGYALVFDSAGSLLKDAARVKAGDEISARLAKGTLTATVKRGKGR
ncbi:MAG TPA: exodeoxyribonuclease VII large subunit [Terriglobales bacterium]|jgi:exodeoxyribonuclease VII large subunit|nr:exodeoxyribonuclease VII large subunit [Terriglobales bacterium]